LNLSKNSKVLHGILIAVVGFSFTFLLSNLNWFKDFDADTWDWRVKALADPTKASDEIVVILLDQPSLDWMNSENEISWPWPREIYSLVTDFCNKGQVKSIAFDVLFNESSHLQGDDQVFASSIEASGVYVLATHLSKQSGSNKFPRHYKKLLFNFEGNDPSIAEFPKIARPLTAFSEKAAALAHVNGFPDQDGVYRKSTPILEFNGIKIPSLSLASYIVANKNAPLKIDGQTLHVGNRTVPLNSNGNTLLRFRGPSKTHKTFSAAAVLQSSLQLAEGKTPLIDPEEFRGKYVFFGFSAPALHDQHNVPVGGKYPGVEVHVTFLDNLLQNDFFAEAPDFMNLFIAAVLALLASLLIIYTANYKGQVIILIMAFALPFLLSFGAAYSGYRISLAFPLLTTLGSSFIAVGYNYMTEGRQKRFIKYAFKHYLSTHFIDQLISNPELLKLGGVRREISIFFSDLEGFTTISEKLDPEILIGVLNTYLSAMSDIILDERGTIDKYEGDAIIAFWNAPLDVKNHAYQVVKSALSMQQKLTDMQELLMEKTECPLKMRIGIHTGPAVVGNMGAKDRFDYTMLGDSVNLAARLEGVNKQFGTYTIISEETYKLLDGAFPARELARVAVVGRKKPVTVFEPMYPKEFNARKESLQKFDRALQLFYQEKIPEALEIFEENRNADPASKKYAKKCRQLIKDEERARKGVWTMTSK
jgi:adenylate cyclase